MTLGEELIRCRPWIEAALEYTGGTHDYEDIVQGCYEARMQLWPAERAAAITEVIVYPRKKVLHVFLAGGEMKQLLDMIADAAEWGRQHGCEAMTMAGRSGWERVLGAEGWRPVFRVMERAI